jgi:hypothetical protein
MTTWPSKRAGPRASKTWMAWASGRLARGFGGEVMAETEEQRLARIASEEESWTGPKFVGLLFATLVVALAFIYGIASYPTESRPFWDLSWYPFGTTPKAADFKPSSVSGLTR